MHSEKAPIPIVVTELGIFVFLQPIISVFVEVSMIALQLFLESYLWFSPLTIIEDRFVQFVNASSPILDNELGIEIDDMLEQYLNAWGEIETVPSLMFIVEEDEG